MRRKKISDGLTVQAISGTHVVFLAFDLPGTWTGKLMGFAIHRRDATEDEEYWLRSTKTFPGVPISINEDASSHEHPFQAFQWADYTAKPDHEYEYRVVALSGEPGHLKDGPEVTVKIPTEPADPSGSVRHGVYFNRGAISSQAYVKRFGLKHPDDVGPSALDWLARDLLRGMTDFIGQASQGDSLHCALYEINFPPVLDALAAAKKRKATVKVLYGATPGSSTTDSNEKALAAIGSPSYFSPRTNAKIAHNKFMVLSRDGKPAQVWTGSTNLSQNAFYGQLNVGHALRNAAAARTYRAYWDALAADPVREDTRAEVVRIAPLDDASTEQVQVIFSPYEDLSVYRYYQALAASARQALFMTYPFGMSREFRKVYDYDDGVLRYALLDKYVNGGNADSRKAAIEDTIRIRKFPNVGMALGERVYSGDVDGWRKERSPIGVNVNWVHTKFMVIDPLSDAPTVVSGSANWSEPSTNENDENMLVIRGDQRVGDIFFTEFMRVFAHHRFREALARHLEEHGNVDDWKPGDLKTKPSEWVPKHYEAGGEYDIRRRYFVS